MTGMDIDPMGVADMRSAETMARHLQVYELKMAGKRDDEICIETGYTRGGVGKILTAYRKRGVVFPPPVKPYNTPGVPKGAAPKVIEMHHIRGTDAGGLPTTWHSQDRADAIEHAMAHGGVVDA